MLSRAPLTLLVPLLLAAVPAAAQERPAASGTTFWGFVALPGRRRDGHGQYLPCGRGRRGDAAPPAGLMAQVGQLW